MQNSSAYITEAPTRSQNPLKSYVNVLNNKLDYAKWKQNLVLSYNYLPLTNIKEKLQNDRINYIKKMQDQQKRLKALVDNQEITTLLKKLSKFKMMLQQNSKKYQQKIEKQKFIVKQLKAKAAQARQQLKEIKRQSRYKLTDYLNQQGIKSVRDIKTLGRSKSTFQQLTARTNKVSFASFNNLQQNVPKTARVTNNTKTNQLFLQCVDSVLHEVKSKNNKQMNKKGQKNTNKNDKINYVSMPTNNNTSKMSFQQFSKLKYQEILGILSQNKQPKQILQTILINNNQK